MGRVRPTSGPRIATANPPTAANPAGLPALRGAGGPRRKARIDAWKPPVRPDRATASGPSAGRRNATASGLWCVSTEQRPPGWDIRTPLAFRALLPRLHLYDRLYR